MFHMVIAGICLAASVATPTISAQLHQNPQGLGFVQPTVAKLPGFTGSPSEGGWPAPPPPPPPLPAGWPAPPTAASADCPLSSIISDPCPSVDGAIPTYLQSYLCGCFFECSNGVPYPFKCPATLQFNPLINVCADYSNGCIIPTTTTTTPIPPTTPPTTPHEASSEECPQFENEVLECPTVDTEPPTYLTSSICGCFYECSNGVPKRYKCPATFQFDPDTKQCADYYDVGCATV